MRIKVWIVILFSLISEPGYCTSGKSEIFQEANQYYNAKNYIKAQEGYEKLLEGGNSSFALHFNLANSYYQNGRFVDAVLHYEKALKIRPANPLSRHNLKLLRDELDTNVIVLPEFFVYRWWKAISAAITYKQWILLQLVSALAFLVSIWRWRFGPVEKAMKMFYGGIISFLLFLIISGASYLSFNKLNDRNHAVVMRETLMYSGADDRAREIRDLRSGVHVEISDSLAHWYKVKLRNKEEGWIVADVVERI